MTRRIVFLLILCFSFIPQSFASVTDWNKTDEAQARLIVGGYRSMLSGEGKNEILKAGIQIKLAEHWKTYWRTPGDGGLAPTIDWSKSKNIKSVEIRWPAPTRFVQFDTIETFGYKDEVILPLFILPEDPTKPVTINAAINYAVCNETCIFLNPEFNITFRPDEIDNDSIKLLDNYIFALPGGNSNYGLKIERAEISVDNNLVIKATSEKGFSDNPDIFVEAGSNLRFPRPTISISNNRKEAIFKVQYGVLLDNEEIDGKTVNITLVDGKKSIEHKIEIPPVAIPPPQKTSSSPSSLLDQNSSTPSEIIYILLLAFIGGLILNIMPCVLPVLSLKLLSVIKHGGKDTIYIRSSFLMSSAGIIFSFLILAAVISALKSAGTAVGWGFQFQQPFFLIFMVIIINMFAANQWGFFEIRLPTWLGGEIHSKLSRHDDHSPMGNFMTGTFATLLATPCSAPILGTAITFALSRNTEFIFLIFTFIGIGLAFPYLLFAFVPKLVSKMPKPGAWMVKVKHALGWLLAATSLWLIWIFSHQAGNTAAFMLLILSILTLVIIGKRRYIPSAGLLITTLIVITFYFPIMSSREGFYQGGVEELWIPFDQQQIPEFVAEGKVVFVDVTADWCLTCKVNKLFLMKSKNTSDLLKSPDIVLMKADYTNPSKEINDYLKFHKRYAIPFNIIYGPGSPEGVVLPELLTEKIIFDGIKKARGSSFNPVKSETSG